MNSCVVFNRYRLLVIITLLVIFNSSVYSQQFTSEHGVNIAFQLQPAINSPVEFQFTLLSGTDSNSRPSTENNIQQEDTLSVNLNKLPANHPFNENVFIAGDFNNWNPADTNYMLSLNNDNTYSITITGKGTVNYKFTRGSWSTVEKGASCNEISNRSISFGGNPVVNNTVLYWADICGGSHTSTPNVSIVDGNFSMPQLGRSRRIWIYLPPDYNTSSNSYPVLYMHDGQNLFDTFYSFSGEWEVDESLNMLYNNGDSGCIVVGIDNDGKERINEYSPWINTVYGGGDGELYASFIVETLKPYIDQHYRTQSDRENTAIMGSSMGALISFYTGLKHQNVFSKIGIFSPSFWFSDSCYSFVTTIPKKDQMKLYFLGGGKEAGVVDDCNRMITTLKNAGFEADEMNMKAVNDGSHNEAFWKSEFSDAYNWLFSKTVSLVSLKESSFKLYPNPATHQINVSLDEEMIGKTYSIIDHTGKELLIGKIYSTHHVINTDSLPQGNYMFSIDKKYMQSFNLKKE